MLDLGQSVSQLQEVGFFNYILPMSIFFLIIYGILEQYPIVSKNKRVNALLALFISAFVLLYAYTNNLESFFSEFYAKMSIALIILLFALSLAVFSFRGLKNNNIIPEGSEKIWGGVLVVLSVMIVEAAFANAPGPVGEWASEVGGLVMALALIAAVLTGFVKGKGEGE